MSTPAVFTFTDQQVRTVVIDGDPWFVLADLARVLCIAAVGRLAARLPEGVRQTHTLDTAGGAQQMTVVSEAGLYRVVLRSDAPNAEPFITWVTEDVLPTIRQTGRYGADVEMLTALPSSQLLLLASQAAERAEAAEARARELEGPARAWTDLSCADGDFTVSDAAKVLARAGVKTGPRKLFTHLETDGWIFRRGGRWQAMQSVVNRGFLVERVTAGYFDQQTGERKQGDPQVRITPAGLERLRGDLASSPALAVVS